MTFRPFVTFPSGAQTFVAAIVRTDADRQAVLNRVGEATQNALGTFAQQIPPHKRREFASKVEFFRVALG